MWQKVVSVNPSIMLQVAVCVIGAVTAELAAPFWGEATCCMLSSSAAADDTTWGAWPEGPVRNGRGHILIESFHHPNTTAINFETALAHIDVKQTGCFLPSEGGVVADE